MHAEKRSQIHSSRIAACGLISGALLGLSFPPIDWSLLAWVALAPLGAVFSSQKMTLQSWSGVYLGGLFFHLSVFDWMRTLYGGVGLDGSFFTGWLISGQFGAVLFCLMVAAGRRSVLIGQLPVTIALPLVWISYEYLQCYFTALFDQSGAQLVSLAYTQADQPTVAQIADLSGVGLVSLVVAAMNGFVFDAVKELLTVNPSNRQWSRALQLATVPLALVTVLVYGRSCLDQKESDQGPNVCLMGKSDLPPLLDESRIQPDPNLPATSTVSLRPDLLVWPELAYHHVLVTPSDDPNSLQALDDACPLANRDVKAYCHTVRKYLEQAAAKFQVGVLIGCERLEFCEHEQKIQRYNCLSYVDPVYGLRDRYDKRHLVPFREFTPSCGRWLQIVNRKSFTHGQATSPIVLRTTKGEKEYQVGCALCYDVAFAEHFRRQQSGDVAFFVVSGSEAADSTGCMSQMLLRMAQFRAIETRRPIVRNTHLGFSGMIDANGLVVRCNDREELNEPWLLGAVPLDTRVSFYSRWGDWLSPACFGALLVLLIRPTLSAVRLPLFPSLAAAEHVSPGLSARLTDTRRQAFSLLELIAVIAIIGTITALVVPKVSASANAVKEASDDLNRAVINTAVERWYLEKDVWPANNLSDISADSDYFPEGIPTNPVNGAAYALNATTHRVIVGGGGGGGGGK